MGLPKAQRSYQLQFYAASFRETSSDAGVINEAFPFLSGRSPADSSRPGSFGALAASKAAASVRVVRDMDAFEAEIYTRPHQPLAIFFSAKQCTHNKQLLEHFNALAETTGSRAKFLVIDVDEVPRAAYHCGVEDQCTFVVQYNGDAFRRRIADPLGMKSPQQLVADFRAALDACFKAVQQSEPPQQQVEWYSHSIPIDNLNVYRVNWPTA